MTNKKNKIVLYIFVLFNSILCCGQSYYVDVNNTIPTSASACFAANPAAVRSSSGFVRLEDSGGNIVTIVNKFSTIRPVKFVQNSGSCRWIEGSNRGRTFSLGGYTFTIPTNQNFYYEKRTFPAAAPSTIYFEVNNVIPRDLECDTNTIVSSPSVVPTSDIIEWEYSLNSSVGVVTNSQNKRSISISSDTFQVDLKQHIGKTIFFRFKMTGGIVSPFKGYKIVSCSPEYKNAIPKNVTCNYDEDGSFELVLGRNLNTNEKLAVTIFEKDTGNVPSGGQNLSIRTLTANSDGTFSYKWPEVLPPNRYEIKYQTGATSEDLSNVFSSLEPSGEVEIRKPKEVTYMLTAAEDKTCFTEDDGYIDVRADGEVGRIFFYQYLKNGIIQKVGGQEWIPFSNEKTTRITGLGKANYMVKVRDSEGCYYRR